MTVTAPMDLPRIETRMLRWMIAMAILGFIVILMTWRSQVAMAFAIGAALGILNFHWLWQTGKVLLEAQTISVPRRTVFLIVLRYPLCFAALVILFCTKWLSPLPVVAGLLVPCAGALVESFLLVRADVRPKQTA